MTTQQTNRFLLIALVLTISAYLIPWVVNTATGLTLSAYDLAEWLSLHPATHPSRLPSLLLRGQLLLITLSIALTVNKPLLTLSWWTKFFVIISLVIAQLPPPEFLAWTGDQNQRQQALLAILSLIGGSIGLTGILHPFRHYLHAILAVIGITSSIYILSQISPRMSEFDLTPTIGVGGIALIGIYIGLIILAIIAIRNTNRATQL